MTQEPRFEILEHTADVAIRAYGKSLKELFENAARGMFALMFDLDEVPTDLCRQFEVQADSLEELLVSWLRELIFSFETDRLAFREFDVAHLVRPGRGETASLTGKAIGGPVAQVARRGAAVKAVTYHRLRIGRDRSSRWQAEVVFDV